MANILTVIHLACEILPDVSRAHQEALVESMIMHANVARRSWHPDRRILKIAIAESHDNTSPKAFCFKTASIVFEIRRPWAAEQPLEESGLPDKATKR
jgi:hypothetical protein